MSRKEQPAVTEIIDQERELGLDEVCRLCNVESEILIEWVEEGIAEPRAGQGREWRFSGHQLRRVSAARRLQRDLEVETRALPLVLDLLEELDRLRRQVRTLERMIDD